MSCVKIYGVEVQQQRRLRVVWSQVSLLILRKSAQKTVVAIPLLCKTLMEVKQGIRQLELRIQTVLSKINLKIQPTHHQQLLSMMTFSIARDFCWIHS